jgi:cyclopropane fatty-acyl-phospholipid synthase-like methyltransferase
MENKIVPSEASSRHGLVGPADLWEAKRRFQINFLLGVGLKPNHKLLDFGCGTLRGGLPLIDYLEPDNYYGLDVRIETLKEACNELEESGLENKRPTLIHSNNPSLLTFTGGFDFIWAFSVLIHLADTKLEEFLSFATRNLKPDGKIFANVVYGEKSDGCWRIFPLVARPQTFYQYTFLKYGLKICDMGALREFGHVARPRPLAQELSQRMLEASLISDPFKSKND